MSMAHKTSHKGALGIGAALAAAAVGAYWFYGAQSASKHRKQARGWMLKARGEVLEAVEKLQDIDKAKYMAIVNDVLARSGAVKGASDAEVAHLKRDLVGAWAHIQKAGKKSPRKGKK